DFRGNAGHPPRSVIAKRSLQPLGSKTRRVAFCIRRFTGGVVMTVRPEITGKAALTVNPADAATILTLNELIDLAALRAAEAAIRELLKRQPRPEAEWLTTEQAASHTGFSVELLEILRHRGEGPPYIKHPRAVRYRRSDLD